jgi:sugar lactone lactonase YvrE
MSTATMQELPSGLEWLNAPPMTLHNLRGRPVVLAFVNAASAWSAHRLAELNQWQARNLGKLQVVVVQTPRFDSERVGTRSLKLLRRLGVKAPVALDADWAAWQLYGVEAWPTLVLIDAMGQERERITGLGGDLEKSLIALCEGLPPPLEEDVNATESSPEPRLPLRFPAAVVANAERLFVADSGHHRVLECNHAGRVLRQFGLGTADFIDGPNDQAAFNQPQGLALERELLFVADTGNNAVRRINLLTGMVDTLVGNGRAGDPVEGPVQAQSRPPLNRPIGLAVAANQVHIACAGDNRIWSFDLGKTELRLSAGTGQLELRDGNAHSMAAFGQPVSLAAVQQQLYVCDALGSAIRSLQLRSDLVQTLVGQGLWEYGDADGPRASARLQHPQGIALSADAPLLWIADSGNGSLRTLRLGGGELSTVVLPRRLHGPTGLSVAAGAVWIAETDAHGILRYDIVTGELGDVEISE